MHEYIYLIELSILKKKLIFLIQISKQKNIYINIYVYHFHILIVLSLLAVTTIPELYLSIKAISNTASLWKYLFSIGL